MCNKMTLTLTVILLVLSVSLVSQYLIVKYDVRTPLDFNNHLVCDQEYLLDDMTIGSEDFVYDMEGKVYFVSDRNRKDTALGKDGYDSSIVSVLDLEDIEAGLMRMKIEGMKGKLYGHGIGLFADEEGKYLFAVNHYGDQDTVEAFLVDDDKGVLQHLYTAQSALFKSLNDVQPVSKNEFYVSNDVDFARDETPQKFYAILTDAPAGSIIYYNHDANESKTVLSDLHFANGVAYIKETNSIYIAATTEKRVIQYKKQPDGTLVETYSVQLDTAPDNIIVDKNGDLIVACHPRLLSFIAHAIMKSRSPNEVVKITDTGSSLESQKVLISPGDLASGSSSAVVHKDILLISTVFERAYICKLKDSTLNKGIILIS